LSSALSRPSLSLFPFAKGETTLSAAAFLFGPSETDNWQTLLKTAYQNLFARQGASHLINLAKTIRLHAYATNIQN
jgi:hypothetical protein